jgi:DNA gyrase subunit A
MRAKALIEEPDTGKPRIIVTEIPFMVNKSRMIEQIAAGAREEADGDHGPARRVGP